MLVFLFTDIEGSTRLWEQHAGAMGAVIARHDAFLRETIEAAGGCITKHTGDGVTAAFERGQPLACALEVQRRFTAEPWGEIGELRIRVGLHAGAAEWIAGMEPQVGDYFGPAVNCAARVMSAAWGGQVLLTPEVTRVSGLPAGASVLDLGEHLLKNVSAPQQLYQLDHPHLPRHRFPPLRTLSGQSIRQAVEQRGEEMAGLAPAAMGVRLLAVTLAPALQGELDPESEALESSLGVLEELGAMSLRRFVAGLAGRLRAGERMAAGELELVLENELQVHWQAGGETAVALRREASRLLQAVHAVEATLAASRAEVKEALARGLAELGERFGEFHWMLAGVQETMAQVRARQELQLAVQLEQLDLQRAQHDLQRAQLAKTDQLLERDWAVPSYELVDEAEPPAFLQDDAKDAAEAPVFVAREQELAQLDRFLQEALASQGRVVFVSGGPGRGKTALLAEFARRAMARHPDLLVVSGNCNAFSGSGDPYLPFREAVGMLSGEVEVRWASGQVSGDHARRLWGAIPAVVQALLRRGPNLFGVLVDSPALLGRATTASEGEAPWLETLRQAVGRAARSTGLEQSHLFEQCTNVLRMVSEANPLVIMLDDLQWADSASIDLLFHLGRRLAGSRILIAGAYRPEEVTLGREGDRHPLEKVVGELKRQFGDIVVDLGRTERDEAQSFVDAYLATEPNQLGDEFREALFLRTEGHPLFTVELLRAMQERGDLVRDEAGRWVAGPTLSWEALPVRVEAVIEERIGRLEEDLREALTVASVEGEEFTAQVVARIQAIQERRLLRQLSRELEKRHRLVLERGEDRVGRRLLSRYRFAHALFQQYLYNDLSSGERRLLHGEVASVLEELFEDKEEEVAVQLAFHYSRAGMEERALPYLIGAAHQARAKFANEEALSYYTEALNLTPQGSPECLDLLAARASVYNLVARRDEQRADAEEMVDLADKLGDAARLCDALLALADYHLETRLVDAGELGEKALRIARSLGDPLRQGQAQRRLGELAWFKGDYLQSREKLERAIELFLDAGAPGEAGNCLHMLSLALGTLNELGPALEAAKESVALSQQAGDRRQEATGLRRVAIAYINQNQYAEALPFARRALALHRELGDRSEEVNALNVLGIIHAWLGEHEQAESRLRQSLSIARSIESSIGICYAVSNLLLYHYVRRGEFEDSLEFLEGLLEDANAAEADWRWAFLSQFRGYSLTVLGQYERAHRMMSTASEMMEKLGDLDSALHLRAWSGLAEAYLGDHEGATETLQTAAERAREGRYDEAPAEALILWGFADLLDGHPRALRPGLERALEGLELIPELNRWLQGFSFEIVAALHLAVGEIDGALEYSTEGLRLMESDPAPWWPERKHFTHSRILRALGREAEADEHLQRAYECILRVAGNTRDPELRRGWLENVEVNREIQAACAQRGIG